jgi:hypothetical protein
MQTVKNFVFGLDRSGYFNTEPLEDQINTYLENHPGYSVSTMSTLNASGYKEAFVVFNIREEKYQNKKAKDNV